MSRLDELQDQLLMKQQDGIDEGLFLVADVQTLVLVADLALAVRSLETHVNKLTKERGSNIHPEVLSLYMLRQHLDTALDELVRE